VLGQELEMFKQAIDIVDCESRAIQAAIVAKVEAEFQAQQARQEQQAGHSQLQDGELQDRILIIEEARANDHANYKCKTKRLEQERRTEAEKAADTLRNRQGHHEAEMVQFHEARMKLSAQVGAMSAQRSVAPTIVTDNRVEPLWNTDAAPAKHSNPTSEPAGGNERCRALPPTAGIAGALDPGNASDEDDKGHYVRGGSSSPDKGKGQVDAEPRTEDEEERFVGVMAKDITRECLLATKRPANPLSVFKHKSHQDI